MLFMRVPLLLSFSQWLFFVVSIATGTSDGKHVDLVMSVDQYYDTVNSNNSYTMIEYTTSWCHHCKKLGPNFRKLMQSYENDTVTPPVKFLEVNCEIFGTTICKGMPGFPKIHLVQPRSKPLAIPHPDVGSLPIWKRLWTRIVYMVNDPKWNLDTTRVFDYKGNRDAKSMRNFIETVRAKDRLLKTAKNALDDEYNCEEDSSEDDVNLCQLGKQYVESTLSDLSVDDLAKERLKCENLIKSNYKNEDENAAETIKLIKFKLEILNLLEENLLSTSDLHDEL